MAEANLEKNDEFKKELAEIDERIENLKKSIQRKEYLEELHEDHRFIEIIVDGYFEREAERIFQILTTPNPLSREKMENLMDKLTAIRNMKEYFRTLILEGQMAPDQITEEEEFRKEITARNSLDSQTGSEGE